MGINRAKNDINSVRGLNDKKKFLVVLFTSDCQMSCKKYVLPEICGHDFVM